MKIFLFFERDSIEPTRTFDTLGLPLSFWVLENERGEKLRINTHLKIKEESN